MEIIAHRVNQIQQLIDLPQSFGAEIDVRYHNDHLVLHHDPMNHHEAPYPVKFDDYLKEYNLKGTLIINLKSEGIEYRCIELMNQFQIENWFFLDLSMPYFVKYVLHAKNRDFKGFSSKNLCVRYSEYEAIEYSQKFKGLSDWVWVDCFTHFPLDEESQEKLSGFKICIVSPELQGHDKSNIRYFKEKISEEGLNINAVCTKYPKLWR